MNAYQCPLCSLDFEGAACHSACPMSKGCAMVRCPRCGYEFVEEGTLAKMVRRLLGGLSGRAPSTSSTSSTSSTPSTPAGSHQP